MKLHPSRFACSRLSRLSPVLVLHWWAAGQGRVLASMFQGETLDSIANVISWVVLLLAPVIGISVFWLVHILPEKIAEKKHHPQVKAIQCLCLLSLCFGGLLWPLAWLWAYTKPVLHKLAYGEDVEAAPVQPARSQDEPAPAPEAELKRLRDRVAELESVTVGKKGRKA